MFGKCFAQKAAATLSVLLLVLGIGVFTAKAYTIITAGAYASASPSGNGISWSTTHDSSVDPSLPGFHTLHSKSTYFATGAQGTLYDNVTRQYIAYPGPWYYLRRDWSGNWSDTSIWYQTATTYAQFGYGYSASDSDTAIVITNN